MVPVRGRIGVRGGAYEAKSGPRPDKGRGSETMNTVMATRAGIDPTLLARLPGEALPTTRAGVNIRSETDEVTVALTRGAPRLAALHIRLDQVNAIALAERTSSGGDPAKGDPERLRKLYPPYPYAYQERAAYLDRLAGLGKLNESLRLPVESAVEPWGQGERLARSVAERLAASPEASLSRQASEILRTNLEG